jgi:hypothetical protein
VSPITYAAKGNRKKKPRIFVRGAKTVSERRFIIKSVKENTISFSKEGEGILSFGFTIQSIKRETEDDQSFIKYR